MQNCSFLKAKSSMGIHDPMSSSAMYFQGS